MAQTKKHRRRKKKSKAPMIALIAGLLALAAVIFVVIFKMMGSSAPDEGGETDRPPEPTAAPAAAEISTPEPTAEPVYSKDIRINEVQIKNKGVVADADGEFSDWLELTNIGTETVSLKGWYLSDTPEQPYEWPIGDVTLAPGEVVLIFCSGKDRTTGELHTNFSLSAGETVTLFDPALNAADSLEIPEMTSGCSLERTEDGTLRTTLFSTPGFENSGEGYEAMMSARECASPVQIWEVVVYEAGKNDWIELKNVSSETVDLADYYLTDSLKKAEKFQALSGTLAPGAVKVFECTAFSLSAQTDTVYLCTADAVKCDWVFLHDIPSGGSCGREDGENGFFYYTASSRGKDNVGGVRLVAEMPVADVPAGVYDDAETLTVTLTGESIRYTTDGSLPTESSPLYTTPLVVSETCVIRAASFPEDALPGDVLTLSYFLRENSTLPIVSLVTDRSNLFGPRGIYSNHETAWANNWERDANVSFFEGEGSFSIDCGIQIHGRTSRRVSEKRSFKLEFKGRYGGELHYDVFGDGRVLDFSSLLLRNSVEEYSGPSYMRDILFADMAMSFTAVPAQNYRYVTLFINGEYYGIYAIREHHSEEYFASHYNVSADSVQCFNGEYEYPGTFTDLRKYAETHNLAGADEWAYMQEHLDVAEMIDWMILECWSGDMDVYENVRFYSSTEYKNNAVLYGLVDMDLTMMRHNTYAVAFECWPQLHAVIPRALQYNTEFREMFLTRLGYLLQNEMSDAAVQARVDALRAIVEPESARDLERWKQRSDLLTIQMDNLRVFIDGRAQEMANSAVGYFGLSHDQAVAYFGDLAG